MRTPNAVLTGLFFISSLSFGQAVSIGVKGGVPLTDAFSAARGNDSAYVSNTKRYTVGPTVEFHLPARFSLEVDALYTRLGYDQVQTTSGGAYTVTRANSWQFPVLAKFEILPGPVRPFVDAGASFRNISGIQQVRTAVRLGTLGTVTTNNATEFNKRNDIGFTAGAGIAFKMGWVRISPEFRYTRWGSEQFRDPINSLLKMSRNDGTFLLGVTF